jgi:hypothetical protein
MATPINSPMSATTPVPLVERLLAPFRQFAHTASSGGVVLLAVTAVALAWANSPWAAAYHHLWETPLTLGAGRGRRGMTLHHFINDGLMAVFFFLVGLEIKREVLAGELASIRRAALPMVARARRDGGAGGALRAAQPGRPRLPGLGACRWRPTSPSPWGCWRCSAAACRWGSRCSWPRWPSSTTSARSW